MNLKMLVAAAAVSMIAGGAAAQTASEWRTIAPENLMVIDTSKGRVLVELEPRAIYNHHLLTIIEVQRRDFAAAQKAAEAEPAGPWQDFALALAAQIGSNRADADARLQACIHDHAEGWAFQIAQVYAVRGEPDAMFEWLGRAWQARDPGMQALLYDALLLRYRNDPRYAALAKQVGLPWPPAATTPVAAVKP